MPIDPKLCEQRHSEINHLFGFRNDDRLALKASEPMALPTMIAFNGMRRRFALDELVLRDD